ncbi:hypothetical protein WDU94_010890 [Cyamophila willieti]
MLRLCRAYRTSSTPVLQVLSGSLPIELMVEEKMKLYELRKSEEWNDPDERRDMLEDLEEEMMIRWQLKWERELVRAKWTKRLIPNIRPWISRNHGELSYELSQLLTGHGNFGFYLHRFKILRTATCRYCDFQNDHPEHTFFMCPRFSAERECCNLEVGSVLSPSNIIEVMLASKENWESVSRMVTKVIKIKEKDGRAL